MTSYPDGMTLRPIASWPHDYTLDRRSSPFSSSLTTTLDTLGRELRHLGTGRRNAESVLQIAMREQDFRIDGLPRANATPQHPGVILNIESRHGTLSYPCDTFTRWQDNLRAITLGLEALRRVERYGITQTGQQYRGWHAIESKPAVDAVSAACVVLARIAWPNENDECQARWAHKITSDQRIRHTTYRQARAKAHPDRHAGDRALWDHAEGAIAVLTRAGYIDGSTD